MLAACTPHPTNGMPTDYLQRIDKNKHLLLTDPNFIIKLLHLHIYHNFFTFADLILQQIKGTAMGAAFSPSLANIFMWVTLRNFLQTQHITPLLMVRYINDIFILWTNDEQYFLDFMTAPNNFYPSLQFTSTYFHQSTDFLDLTIFKGQLFRTKQWLDIWT